MNLLLDTHVVLWWLADEPIADGARAAIVDPDHTVFLSAVVMWEIRLKQSIGTLVLPSEFRTAVDAESFVHLPLTVDHADALERLPAHHRDPFDRMLVAQALVERLTLVSRDREIARYDVPVLEA